MLRRPAAVLRWPSGRTAFGDLIVELDAVRALDRPNDQWRFVFGVRPGF